MRVLAGIELAGATRTPLDELVRDGGSIGQCVFGPQELLRDLELRLGLQADLVPQAVRVAHFAERMTRASREAPGARFYSRSFEHDPLGTAERVLELRDRLVGAGWHGEPVAQGGARLEALHELEVARTPPLPLGFVDRVAGTATALETTPFRVYEELQLAEPRALWSATWQRIFQGLERGGTLVRDASVCLPGAPPESDLGQLQAALRLGGGDVELRGDGSFVVLEAETSWEAARATAALLASYGGEHAVVIRGDDASALDHALLVHGLRTQGTQARSPSRSALAILPLALELAFEPKDPYRVLELLTLPFGPFQGFVGHRLARALAESPGIGSPDWEDAKRDLSTREGSAAVLERLHSWVEERGVPPDKPARKAELLAVLTRVRSWFKSAIARSPGAPVLLAAARCAGELTQALSSDPRETFTLFEVQGLIETVVGPGVSAELLPEQAGRVDWVDRPGALRVPRELVVWWSFTSARSRVDEPFLREELRALARAGLSFPDPKALLSERAHGYRCALLAATRRVLLVIPRSAAGHRLTPHALWDEIVALGKLDDAAQARISVCAPALRTPSLGSALFPPVPLSILPPRRLPGGRPEWQLTDCDLLPVTQYSASSLEQLFACPLRWVLSYRAHLHGGGHSLPKAHLLNGKLGHRLIERLHEQGAFELKLDELAGVAKRTLGELFQTEGATLLRRGQAFERAQLEQQLLNAVSALTHLLGEAGLKIQAVEVPIDLAYRDAKLIGRIDLLLGAEDGRRAVFDVKWGLRKYQSLLNSGRSLQLALYAFAITNEEQRALPSAAYFSLSRGKLVALKSLVFPHGHAGATLEETWRKVEHSLPVFERALGLGKVPVAGLRRSLSVLQSLGVSDAEQVRHYGFVEKKPVNTGDACEYCAFDALCGKRWEAA